MNVFYSDDDPRSGSVILTVGDLDKSRVGRVVMRRRDSLDWEVFFKTSLEVWGLLRKSTRVRITLIIGTRGRRNGWFKRKTIWRDGVSVNLHTL